MSRDKRARRENNLPLGPLSEVCLFSRKQDGTEVGYEVGRVSGNHLLNGLECSAVLHFENFGAAPLTGFYKGRAMLGIFFLKVLSRNGLSRLLLKCPNSKQA